MSKSFKKLVAIVSAIAMVMVRPNFKLLVEVIKVAIPSGTLCNTIATMLIIPILYNPLLSAFTLLSGKYLSINIDIMIPNVIKIKLNIILGNKLLLSSIILNELGSKSVNDTHVITPAAKERLISTILLFFLLSKKITNAPITVDIPAKKDNIKAYKHLFGIIIPPFNLYA